MKNNLLIANDAVPDMEDERQLQKLKKLIDSSLDIICSLDAEGRFIEVSAAAERVWGYQPEELKGKYCLNFLTEEDKPATQAVLNRIVKGEEFTNFENHYYCKDGSLKPIVWSATWDDEDRLMYCVGRDATERNRKLKEQKKNTRKLKQVQNNLLNVLESMTDGFFTVNRNWEIKYATDKVAAMLGVNKEDYVGKNLWACFPQAVNTKFYTEYHRAFAEQKVVSFEEFLPSFNIWFEVNAYPYKNVLAIYIKDITQRKNDEKRLEFIARATSEVIWEREISSDETFINAEKFRALFGYRLPGNTMHRSFWLEKIHPDDIELIKKQSQLVVEERLDYFMHEYRFRKSDGTWAYVKDRTYLVRDEDNKPIRKIGAMQDITAERLAEKALTESEKSYKQLFENAPLPKMVYDSETLQFLDVNQAAINCYGYSREAFLTMNVMDIREEKDRPKVFEILSGIDRANSNNMGVWKHVKKSGASLLAEIFLIAISYKGRAAYLISVHDVTEKAKLQETLIKEKVKHQKTVTKATIEGQEKERSDIGKELHDNVNQILTTAKLYVENIKYFPEQKNSFVDKSAALLQKAINEIRFLSKALVTPTIRDLGFEETLQELIAWYRELNLFTIDYTYLMAECCIDKDLKLTLYRILQEELNNTVKYAKASAVTIRLQHGEQLKMVYEDNGIGFDPATQKKGLGLNNIKNRADVYNGTVHIDSSPGNGCRIEIIFPLEA